MVFKEELIKSVLFLWEPKIHKFYFLNLKQFLNSPKTWFGERIFNRMIFVSKILKRYSLSPLTFRTYFVDKQHLQIATAERLMFFQVLISSPQQQEIYLQLSWMLLCQLNWQQLFAWSQSTANSMLISPGLIKLFSLVKSMPFHLLGFLTFNRTSGSTIIFKM